MLGVSGVDISIANVVQELKKPPVSIQVFSGDPLTYLRGYPGRRFILFMKKQPSNPHAIAIYVKNTRVPASDSAKLLGVTPDKKLTMNKHFEDILPHQETNTTIETYSRKLQQAKSSTTNTPQ